MRKLWPIALVSVIWIAAVCTGANAQQTVKEKAWQISLPAGWTRTESTPPGMDVGFHKQLSAGQEATLYFHDQVMPEEAGNPPADTSGMQSQWNTMVENKYPDARIVKGTTPKVKGRILINGSYELTDDGAMVHRQYVYFLSNRTVFLVQCSAPPQQWPIVVDDFDTMLASLQPGSAPAKMEAKSDASVIAALKNGLPTLLNTFPLEWRCALKDVTISPASSNGPRTLNITLSFDSPDIRDTYQTAKTALAKMKTGNSNALDHLPAGTQRQIFLSAEFIKYVGQVLGASWNFVINCHPPIERYTVSVLDSKGQQVGSVSLSKEALTTILTGKVKTSDEQKVASLYVFE